MFDRKSLEPFEQEFLGKRNWGTCWFCETRPADAKSLYKVDMWDQKNLKTIRSPMGKYVKHYYETTVIYIPQCTTCAKNRDISAGVWFFSALSLVAAVASYIILSLNTKNDCLAMLVGGGVFLTIFALYIYVSAIRPRSRMIAQQKEDAQKEFKAYTKNFEDYPQIRDLKEKGWVIGTGP